MNNIVPLSLAKMVPEYGQRLTRLSWDWSRGCPMAEETGFAGSASDNIGHRPFGLVGDSQRNSLNVTAELLKPFTGFPFPNRQGGAFGLQPFLPNWSAVKLAGRANREWVSI